MLKKKELEFEINGNVLTVIDFDWFIDKIDAIYVRNSQTIGKKSEYAIFIQQASEIIELYFRTRDEMIIAREYKKLYEAIQAVNPMFDNSVEHFVLINYGNLKEVKYDSSWKGDFIKLEFNNFPLYINGGKKKCNKFKEKLDEINGKDFIC